MSAVFILMVIMHLLIVMYNNMSDNSISFEEQYFYETNAGNSMGKLCFWMFVLKTDLYSFMGFFFSIYTQYVSVHTEDKAHSYLPHPTLPILNG